ncbi:hypothetical protein PtrSN002B_008587 [Pyrenophora tritici-repentis]|uniref:Uncharacterized protein n=1 Tax=Pyrenophora tritici-repentis TaxID=45151 RepID=A0A2W1EE65_9PLEO|nr:hypothetical protein PtrV1_08595 [Pyrenophora tritici-repentis]KAF7449637.1 hypothetical protein A1F99_066860 [Pyrenophora tritici-repentis]KAF7570242.1 hypothetical protein PtrM4_102440 [Pyrenophora tritici-repentis]KAG9383430.1 hypothetical protein A1F94_005341 [Pyrenophora tritici-repentis]KAI0572844.1 hypothetical protein Alg215_09542 [Pyrenophora tritici-repentis]
MSAYDMNFEQRAPSMDMTSVELRDMSSPAPTYSSTFHSEDISSTSPRHASVATSKSGTPNNPYYQSNKHWPLPLTPHPELKAPAKDEEEAQVKPDYQDPKHPHFAQSIGPDFPTTLPPRSRMPQKRVLIPWILFIIFFLITLWYTSMLFGARFLSITRPLPPPTPQINVYINGDIFQGAATLSISTAVIQTSSPTSTPPRPTPTPEPSSSGDALPDMSNDLDRIFTQQQARSIAAPTAFVTVTRGWIV